MNHVDVRLRTNNRAEVEVGPMLDLRTKAISRSLDQDAARQGRALHAGADGGRPEGEHGGATMNREAWLAERKKGIGSSDAAAVCGVNPYSSAAGVWLEKTGRLPAKLETAPMTWGTKLEDVIAEAYAERTGRPLVRAEANLRHGQHGFMIANIDRETDDAERRIVECKNVSIRQAKHWGEPGTDEVPEWYLIQVTHQMLVTGRELADVAALFGGNDFRIYTVPFNPILGARVVEIEADFWSHVERDEQPAWDWQHPSTPELVKAMYAPGEDVVSLDEAATELVGRYGQLGAAIEEAKDERAMVQAQIIAAMKDAGAAMLEDGTTITRKIVQRNGYTVAPTSYVDFRIKKPSVTRKRGIV